MQLWAESDWLQFYLVSIVGEQTRWKQDFCAKLSTETSEDCVTTSQGRTVHTKSLITLTVGIIKMNLSSNDVLIIVSYFEINNFYLPSLWPLLQAHVKPYSDLGRDVPLPAYKQFVLKTCYECLGRYWGSKWN